MPPPVLAASAVSPAADVAAAPDNIQLEVLERLRAVLATEDGTTNEGGVEESQDDDEPHLFRLSLIFAHSDLCLTRTRHKGAARYRHASDSFTSDKVLFKR
ncbi:hypothetical protein EDD15DRAFT_2191509 [Pisolithus albus]|nr:hypothetical protein EDD15DRAFT_2191509 [Pisolithus albus]